MSGDENWEVYCQSIGEDGQWADHIAVVGLAHMLQQDILIITSSPLGNNDHLTMVVGKSGFTGTPILLGHNSADHWEHHFQSLQSVNLHHKGNQIHQST